MSKYDSGKDAGGQTGKTTADKFFQAVVHANDAMQLERRNDGTALAIVPMRRPKYLVPPISWILPYSTHRRVELDSVGVTVLDMCDGRTVEGIIEKFALDHKLSFRESQLAVGQFLRDLARRGIVAIVGLQEDLEKRCSFEQPLLS